MAKEHNGTTTIASLASPWTLNGNGIWLASTLRLSRNVENFEFPSCLSMDRKKAIVNLLGKGISTSASLRRPALLRAEELSTTDKEYLLEHYLSTHSFHQTATGEAFVIDASGVFLGTINIDDHLSLQLTDISGELEAAWNLLTAIEKDVGGSIKFAFSHKFGFLTADPGHSGTAFQLLTYLHVPALIHLGILSDTLKKALNESIVTTGLQGDSKSLIGDLLVLQNAFTLGVSEENIISTMNAAVVKLIGEEKAARKRIRESGNPHIKDLISRAFGLLRHSYQTETVEALNAISMLKLGCDLGWVTGVTVEQLNALLFTCRRGHVGLGLDGKSPEVSHTRAELIHGALATAALAT